MIMKMKNEELKKYPFPNLIAEIYESLKEKPYLHQFMKMAAGLKKDAIKAAAKMLTELNKNRSMMKISNIHIFPCFQETPPDPEKLQKKEEYYNKTGILQSPIVLDGNNYLIDGYCSYLIGVKYGMKHVPIKYGKRQIVWCYHKKGGKLYAWELPGLLIDRVSPGERLIVETSRGLRTVRVSLVEDCVDQEPGAYKRAVRKRKRGSHTMNCEVIRQVEMKNGDIVPMLNITMMSDERWNELTRQRAIKHYIRENGKEPESVEAAFKWQRQWVREIIES